MLHLQSGRSAGGRSGSLDSENHLYIQLLNRAAAGDQGAFAELYDQCAPELLGLLYRILRCRSLAEEVLQEVFLQAWRQIESYRPESGNVKAWLLMMARSRGIDRLRQERASSQRHALHGQESSRDIPPLGTIRLEWRERRLGLLRALGTLTLEQRACLELALYEGLTQTEISTRLAAPLGTVKSRLRMGMMKVRAALEEAGGPVGSPSSRRVAAS